MLDPTMNTIKAYALAVLVALFAWLPLGNDHSSFAEEPMIVEFGDIEMWIDTSETFDDEAQMFNNFLNVFIAAYVATDGNLEVVALDRHTICISGQNGSCLSKVAPQNRNVAVEVVSKGPQMTILSAYNE